MSFSPASGRGQGDVEIDPAVVGDPRRRRPDIGKEHAAGSVIEAGRDQG